jgi:hypothetical protein
LNTRSSSVTERRYVTKWSHVKSSEEVPPFGRRNGLDLRPRVA